MNKFFVSSFLAGVSFLAISPARAEEAADAAAEVAAAEADGTAIVVTGARGRIQRSVADSPVPIDVIGPQELKNTGRTGLKEILGNIIPSLSMPALGGGGTSASVRPISIRGLSGDYVLVLVNGKRRHTTSLINNLSRISGGSTPVDIDLIPTSGVGRIEVLRDGAAAQYGSDAISGVINIILDNTARGGELSVTGGQLYEKGGALAQVSGSYGVGLGDGGFARFAVEAKYHDRADSSAEPVPYVYPLVDGQPDPREADANHLIAGGYGRSNRDKIVNTSYNAELPLGDDTTLYSFSTLSYRNIKDARGAYFASATGYGGLANSSGASVLPQLYPAGFQAYRRIWEWDFQAALGLRSEFAGWSLDVSSSFGRDNVKLGAENTLNPSLGPDSKSSFFMGRQKQDLWVNNLDISRDLDLGLARPVSLSLGVEHRWEWFRNIAGEPDSYRDGGYVIPLDDTPFGQLYGGRSPSPGLVSFTGTSPADASSISRNNVAAYVDISADLTPGWFLGLAGRFEHYSDSAGNTFSAKASTRVELAKGLALRGGVNTGFRAPSLAQTAFSTTQNTVTVIGDERVSTVSKFLPVNSAAAIALGAKPLKPEKSLNFTAGVTYETGPFRLTVDAYQIRIDDRIVKTEFLGTASNGGAAIKDILVANGIDDVDSAQFFTNAIDTRTRGVDVVGEYTLDTASVGTFRLNAAYSYNRTKILHVIDNPDELSTINVTLFGRQAQRDLVAALPRSKVVLSSNWSLDKLRALVRVTRYGQYTESSNVAASDRTFGAKWVTDAEIGYQLTDNFDIAVGANNLFDLYPDRNGAVAADGSGLYGNFAPFGLSGGFYYARLGVKF
ncbi:TonB-dependent receptor [Novosphingobium sp. ST904]|uniref:TonB-dependent receptor plug domain-containing protein n=1 Tax=Novosphingobium sp. ST904 TaxID=1684385 RepID=UPI0006C864EE|nr:TonB-dependent receptor [Novosphingobium sp. ST904]KPH65358.1 TonB-dependent receptor [Novosphingobium sp. ST904]TCM30750.1 iron complex outermembrane receptor protein [Novosphingobium sp. ST904]